ncbi:11017_t:CDS:2 [Funneliformis caledonium]|uniref:11017_t:CDS:1 n=1 Tax=Funneliformis caledonium TaxID=1117310 RepID=A0A9N9CET1_9GLOM|nr:11017_t:CDS:2 [Funneliformis caledonium]
MSAFQKSHSYLISDEEKAESGSISSFGSKSSIKRSSYNGYQYIAISPDGTQIVTLNTSTHQLKLCKHDNLSKFYTINYDEFKSYDKPLTKINWSLTVSNAFTLADGTEDVLIVVSCFDDDDMKCNQIPDDEVETVYMYDDMNKRVETSTWIISCTQHSRVSSSINKMGGIVKFLDIKDDNISHLVLINALGITKFSIEHETIREIIYNGGGLHDDGWSNHFFSNKSIQEFHLPPKFFLEMQRFNEDDITQVFVVWDLFSSSDYCVRKIDDTSPLFPEKRENFANASGNLFTVTERGDIISILKESEIVRLLNPVNDFMGKTISLEKFHAASSLSTDYHYVYDSGGNLLDFNSEYSKIIIYNSEPWVHDNRYKRISAYLDDKKSIQLIIGKSTVQVWRKRRGGTAGSSPTRILEFIWAHSETDNQNKMEIQSLAIGNKEFSLTLRIPSGISPNPEPIKLEWPEKSWNGTDKEFTDLEIAIECTKGGYRKDTVIVKYLLDYYSDNAAKTSNWMFTVTKAIPFLYKYQLEFYVKELFQKPCFGANEVYLEKSSIRNSDMTKSSYKNIHALNVDLSLVKREKNNFLQRIISQGKQSGKETISNLVNKEFKTPSLINQVYMVPLPDFTVYPEGIDDKREEYWKIPFKLLRLLIWPRGHIIKKEEKLSPFLRMIRNDNSAAIYDNPSIAAVIDFKWNAARKYFLRHVVVYFVFALTYALLTSAIKGSNRVIAKVEAYLDVYLIIANVFFYWLGFYILNTERVQLKYDGWKRYFSVYNFFDLFSVILPLITATIQIFELEQSPQDFRKFTILNSFTILTMWMELFLLLRYFEKAGAYIFIIVKILQEITSFLTFILLVVLGFGHAMFVLLNNTSDMNLNAEGTSFKIYGNDGNPVPDGAYEEAKEVGRHAVLKYRAELIADYETIDKPLGNRKGNPRYIYFIGKSDYIEEWLEKAEKARESHKNFLAEIDNSNSWYYDDDEDDEETMYYCHTPRTPQDLSYGYSISSGASSVDSISINSQRTERQVPLSINWFVDEDERVKDKSSNDHNHKSKEEVKTLQDKVQSMEQDIKYLITLIQNQK